ncbi:MAG: sulfatase-like hydrolase/transferase, partial [Verrucomicrobiota bacterium]
DGPDHPAIDQSGESANTLVLFSSDNGGIPSHGGSNIPLRGNKFGIYEGGVRVPAALRWPAVFKESKVNDDTLSYIDVWPTFAAIAGMGKHGTEIDGKDMQPSWAANAPSWDRTLYLREGGVIHGEWKLVALEKDCKDPAECGQLFNLKNDPYEKRDLAGKMPEKVRELAELIKAYKKLRGPAFESRYKSETWPPENWVLPDEPES